MNEFFPDIPQKITFEGPDSKNPLAFKYYNPEQIIDQKTMKEHLRFSIAYWHTFKASGMDPFIKERYVSYTDGIGKRIMDGRESFDSMEQYILQRGNPALKSGRQEMLEGILHSYV